MKTATANRVYVLHKEGNMPYRHRGATNTQTKKKKKKKNKDDEDEDEDDGEEDYEEDDDDVRSKVRLLSYPNPNRCVYCSSFVSLSQSLRRSGRVPATYDRRQRSARPATRGRIGQHTLDYMHVYI